MGEASEGGGVVQGRGGPEGGRGTPREGPAEKKREGLDQDCGGGGGDDEKKEADGDGSIIETLRCFGAVAG